MIRCSFQHGSPHLAVAGSSSASPPPGGQGDESGSSPGGEGLNGVSGKEEER